MLSVRARSRAVRRAMLAESLTAALRVRQDSRESCPRAQLGRSLASQPVLRRGIPPARPLAIAQGSLPSIRVVRRRSERLRLRRIIPRRDSAVLAPPPPILQPRRSCRAVCLQRVRAARPGRSCPAADPASAVRLVAYCKVESARHRDPETRALAAACVLPIRAVRDGYRRAAASPQITLVLPAHAPQTGTMDRASAIGYDKRA